MDRGTSDRAPTLDTLNDLNDGQAAFLEYQSVYVDPSSFEAYKRNGRWHNGRWRNGRWRDGRWRDGTVVAKE